MEQLFLTIPMKEIILIAWIIAAVVLIIVEALNSGILAVWFAIGSACAAIVAYIWPGSYIAQLITFLAVSTILTIIGTNVFKTKQQSEGKKHPVYSIIGKVAVVTKEINNLSGEGKISINGDTWSAKSKDETTIPENAKVKVLDIDGVKAVVELIKE